ncbi:MAG: hypothetical protein AAF337_00535 [Pseudomonadota bacterium]
MRYILLVIAALGLATPALAAPKLDPNEITEAHFIKFEPILMTVVQERRIQGLVQLQVTLKLADPNEWEEITRQRARIKDKLVQAVGGMTHGAIRVDRPLNIALITSVLQRRVDAQLGAERARVLIIDASTRLQ